jgi:hypothetical protein
MIGVVAWTIAVVMFAVPAASQWRVVPEVRVTGGDESDLVVDPGVTRMVVPGGAFVEITPTLTARRWIGRATLIDLGSFATLQRFLNDDGRLLYAHTAWGDLYRDLHENVRGRISTSLDYFSDSEREAVQRLSGGVEMGLAWVRPRWNAELWGGANGRRYPNLTTVDARDRSTTYAEATWSGGTTLRFSPAERVAARADGILQTTAARDSYFDSHSWTVSGSVDTRLVTSLFLTLFGAYQARDFVSRPAGQDADTYAQFGAGLRYVVAGAWTASIRYGHSIYTWPDGGDEDSHRLAVAIHYAWGRRDAPPVARVDIGALTRESGGSVQQPDTAGNVRLRVRAVDAGSVVVAGDFNAWDAGATRLRLVGDGWWEVELRLVPGNYEYVYVIDGVWTTPPEAKITVEDGYGGRNGVLEILPSDSQHL